MICKICNTDFQKNHARQVYCSLECKKTNKNLKRKKQPTITNCVICTKEFVQKRKDNKTCGSTCSQKLWIKNNPEKNWDRHNGETSKIRQKKWREDNRDKVRAIKNRYKKKKYNNDVLYKLKENISNLIRDSFRSNGIKKNTKSETILGCTIDELKLYLETKFEPWMNWENRGNCNGIPTEINMCWDIDHIIPLDTAITENDIIKLNHHTNLQPMCSFTNRFVKRNNIKF